MALAVVFEDIGVRCTGYGVHMQRYGCVVLRLESCILHLAHDVER